MNMAKLDDLSPDSNAEFDPEANDALIGALAIAEGVRQETGEELTEEQTFYMLSKGQLPGFKLPGSRIWRSRRSLIRLHYRRAEEEYRTVAG